MKVSKLLAAGFAATMLLAACGGGSSDREELLKSLEEETDFTTEQKDCIKDFTDGYSDDELSEIRKEVDVDDVDFDAVSEQSQGFMNGVVSCMTGDGSAMIDEVINSLGDEVSDEAKECIRTELTGIDAEQLSSLAEDQSVVMDLVTDCMLG